MQIIEPKRYEIAEVFGMIGEGNLLRRDSRLKKSKDVEVDGFKVHPISLRYMTFYQKGTTCVCCGKVGTHFKLCGDDSTARRHFNLFADDGTLITKDHILPKSKGGEDTVENLQPMCEKCNAAKGNYHQRSRSSTSQQHGWIRIKSRISVTSTRPHSMLLQTLSNRQRKIRRRLFALPSMRFWRCSVPWRMACPTVGSFGDMRKGESKYGTKNLQYHHVLQRPLPVGRSRRNTYGGHRCIHEP